MELLTYYLAQLSFLIDIFKGPKSIDVSGSTESLSQPTEFLVGLHGKGHRGFSCSSSPPNKVKASVQRVTTV